MKIHTFDNGVQVYDHHLLPGQRERYQQNNLHEPEEESVFLDVIDKLDERAAFINVGAAIGYYAILAKRQRPDLVVHAYEPLKTHRQYLQKNLALNGLGRSDVVVFDEGIDRTDGVAAFRSQDFSSRLDRKAPAPGRVKKFFHRLQNNVIKTISLEQAIERSDGRVGLVSMDIQGAEISVVNASKSVIAEHRVDYFLIGTHGPQIHKDIVTVFEQCGYGILFEEHETKLQPDGIVLAGKVGR